MIAPAANAETYETPSYAKGLPPVKIKSVKAIATAPQGSNLIVVKVETTEPGLYGLGCATFTQRAVAVVTAINSYLNDFCVGKDVDNIEDMWNAVYVSSYWRNGPVLNNALSGLDEALWDIKGKRANRSAARTPATWRRQSATTSRRDADTARARPPDRGQSAQASSLERPARASPSRISAKTRTKAARSSDGMADRKCSSTPRMCVGEAACNRA